VCNKENLFRTSCYYQNIKKRNEMQTIVGSTNNVAEHQPKNNKIHFANVLLYVMSRMSLFHKNHRFHLLKITALQTIIINTAGKIITVEKQLS